MDVKTCPDCGVKMVNGSCPECGRAEKSTEKTAEAKPEPSKGWGNNGKQKWPFGPKKPLSPGICG
ncbi:MAG: hypothetical protein PHQ42_04820 [Patescibacteria group bacterium]|nr:hypothetical protein [Patescibacteria group bacterium]